MKQRTYKTLFQPWWTKVCFIKVFLMIGVCISASTSAIAQERTLVSDTKAEKTYSWHLLGHNSFRPEYYGVTGDQSVGPYAFRDFQGFDEFDLTATYKYSKYRLFRGQFFGLLNGSDYRNPRRGVVPERVNVMTEHGDWVVPYRVEIGDFFGYFSYRTLQKSLKGIQIEIQPKIFRKDIKNSLILLSGISEPEWKNFSFNDNYTNGFSWLIEPNHSSRYHLSIIHALRTGRNAISGNQVVFGLGGERRFHLLSQNLLIETEADYFTGNYGTPGPSTGTNRTGHSVLMRISGRSKLPLTYQLRYEQNSLYFTPDNAVIIAGRRTVESQGSWKFKNGMRTRGRFQYYQDNWSTADPTDTYTYGISGGGIVYPKLLNDLTADSEFYYTTHSNRSKSTNSRVINFKLALAKVLYHDLTGNLKFFLRDLNDKSNSTLNRVTRQVDVTLGTPFEFSNVQAYIAPGLLFRSETGGNFTATDFYPTFLAQFHKNHHELNFNLGYEILNRNSATADVNTFGARAQYRYLWKAHTFGLEYEDFFRNPNTGSHTHAYRVAGLWTYKFDWKKTQIVSKDLDVKGLATQTGASLIDLLPNLSVSRLRMRMKESGFVSPTAQPDRLIYPNVDFIPDVFQRQKVVVMHSLGVIDHSMVVIEFDQLDHPQDMMRTFERARGVLLRQLGNPDHVYDRGLISKNLVSDINQGIFVRSMEWIKNGMLIRFGIPQRLDHQVRMEIQIAPTLPSIKDPKWSLEKVL